MLLLYEQRPREMPTDPRWKRRPERRVDAVTPFEMLSVLLVNGGTGLGILVGEMEVVDGSHA